ncbi:hypothetical protein B0T24DRAFT_534097, partial [Lasiosphaeria ovina]
TRTMFIVYYDSYVQLLVEDLVRFVSIGRNMIRKVKADAKLARPSSRCSMGRGSAKRDDDDGTPIIPCEPEEQVQSLCYMSARQVSAFIWNTYGAGGTRKIHPDVYDNLDKCLESIQSLCELVAHQFLRDGDCATGVDAIKKQLDDTTKLAEREMECIERKDLEQLEQSAKDESRVSGLSVDNKPNWCKRRDETRRKSLWTTFFRWKTV